MKSANGGKALLFENTGTDFPVLVNMMGNEQRMLLALNADSYLSIGNDIEYIAKLLMSQQKKILLNTLKHLPQLLKLASLFPKTKKKKGACQQIIHTKPDLSILPVLKCWPYDGGPFITLPIVITKHPITNTRNVGMYRMQILDKETTGMHWHLHKGGAAHFKEYQKLNKKMPVAVVLGGNPAYTYCATAPLPDGIDEFLLAAYLQKKKVQMVKCISQNIEVPADADIVIEGYIDPNEEPILEGPFGDHTGFYSLADYYPKFHVTCITHQKNAIYPATIVGVPPMEDAEIARATERIFLSPVKMLQPEVTNMHLPNIGVAHNLVLLNVNTMFPGHGIKVLHSILGSGQMMFSKVLVSLPEHIDIFNLKEVFIEALKRVNVQENISFSTGPADVLDHASFRFAKGGKLLIDATGEPSEIQSGTLIPLKESGFIISHKTYHSYGIVSIDKTKLTEGIDTISEVMKIFDLLNLPKMILIVDSNVKDSDHSLLAWWILSNIDPKTDVKIHKHTIFVNATIKTNFNDGFERNWPNVVAMDTETIERIDTLWTTLNIGPFVDSPTRARNYLISGQGATYQYKKQ
jgi:4-hydroxy-3-polyprenylbenzoate decarboxylase